jgi:hypothetical protein
MNLPYWSQDEAVKDWLRSSGAGHQHDISAEHNAQSQSDHQEGGQVPRLLQSFHELCMQKRVEPHYNIESYYGGFRGNLRVGEHHVSVDGPLQNKKAVREQLAAKGMTIVKSLTTRSASPIDEDVDAVNWVGKLQGDSSTIQVNTWASERRVRLILSRNCHKIGARQASRIHIHNWDERCLQVCGETSDQLSAATWDLP